MSRCGDVASVFFIEAEGGGRGAVSCRPVSRCRGDAGGRGRRSEPGRQGHRHCPRIRRTQRYRSCSDSCVCGNRHRRRTENSNPIHYRAPIILEIAAKGDTRDPRSSGDGWGISVFLGNNALRHNRARPLSLCDGRALLYYY